MKKYFLIEKASGTVYAVSDGKIEFSSDKLELVEIDVGKKDLDEVLRNKPAKVVRDGEGKKIKL